MIVITLLLILFEVKMEKILIDGCNKLSGEITISGMKNSILPIIFACLLVKDECIIENVPRVSDVFLALDILKSMGADADFIDVHTVRINTKNAENHIENKEPITKMRASSYLMGVMLARFGSVCMPMPGGCDFGTRPIDLHLKGFSDFGAECCCDNENIEIFTRKKLKCNKIILDKISVGATINMVLVSSTLDGTSQICNCALEPHVDDLINFLNQCGANIYRNGSSIICNGVKELHGTRYCVYPDMIEALTYITLVGACSGKITMKSVHCEHLKYELELFAKMGYCFTTRDNELTVTAKKLYGADVVTAPYPCFPTDLHPQFAALLCFAENGGVIREEIFPTRFAYVEQLEKMGAKIDKHQNTVHIKKSKMNGAVLDASDLRAGAGLVVAAMGATGKSEINNVNYIVRGYENLVEKVSSIGGNINLIKGV